MTRSNVDAPDADGLTAGERFARIHDEALRLPEPVDLSTDEPSFHATIEHRNLGSVTIASLTTDGRVSLDVRRTSRLVRRSDPEAYRLLLNLHGRTALTQGDRDTVLQPGDMTFYDTSLPHQGWRRVDGGNARLLMLAFPHSLLPIPQQTTRLLAGVRLSGSNGVGKLVASLLTYIADDINGYRPATSTRLSTTILDLIAVMLGDLSDEPARRVPDAEQQTLLVRVQTFIEQRLDDPDLSPATICAAHHIAARTLYRQFQAHDLTVSGWIRHRRLERCRRDLIDPRLAGHPIYAIATRHGFADGAQFTRSFRTAYGVSPRDYRHAYRDATLPDTQAPVA
jgi:AraC-like DNA-binding protein